MPYTAAKTQSERRAWRIAEEHDLDLRVINPTAILGGGFSATAAERGLDA